jgi:hypothetical protein
MPSSMNQHYVRITEIRKNQIINEQIANSGQQANREFIRCTERRTQGMGNIVTFNHLREYENCKQSIFGR